MITSKEESVQITQQIYQSLQKILRTIDFAKNLKGQKPSITLTQMRVLSFFSEQDVLHISEVSKALNMSMASVNNLVTRLEKSGYVKRSKNRENKRFSDICLTAKGKQSIASFGVSHGQIFGHLLDKLEKDEIEELNHLLARASQIIDKASP